MGLGRRVGGGHDAGSFSDQTFFRTPRQVSLDFFLAAQTTVGRDLGFRVGLRELLGDLLVDTVCPLLDNLLG